VILAVSAGLLHMVAQYTDDDRATPSADRLAGARAASLEAAEADGARSADFGVALALPSGDPTRDDRVAGAALLAAASSAELGAVGARLLPEVELLTEIGNPNVAADLAIAAESLALGISGATINLRADLRLAQKHEADAAVCDALARAAETLDAARARASALADQVRARFGD
jgi:formiminotetrahydrofolate cyclodeaminase